MKKISIYLSLLFLITGCSTLFSKKEYKELTDLDNYQKYEVKYHSLIEYDNNIKALNVTFTNLDTLNQFMVNPIQEGSNLLSYPIGFTLFEDSYKALEEKSFFDNIKVEDDFTIWACNYKNKGVGYTYILSVEYNNVTYLNQKDGMNNIKQYLDEHRSPFFN